MCPSSPACGSSAAPMGIPVLVAVAPKSYANQPGLLYEGMDYAGHGPGCRLDIPHDL